jgi:hypothetical protein
MAINSSEVGCARHNSDESELGACIIFAKYLLGK